MKRLVPSPSFADEREQDVAYLSNSVGQGLDHEPVGSRHYPGEPTGGR